MSEFQTKKIHRGEHHAIPNLEPSEALLYGSTQEFRRMIEQLRLQFQGYKEPYYLFQSYVREALFLLTGKEFLQLKEKLQTLPVERMSIPVLQLMHDVNKHTH